MTPTQIEDDLAEARRVATDAIDFLAAHGSLPSSEAVPLVQIIAQLCAQIELLRGDRP